jgi:hypothetical protein
MTITPTPELGDRAASDDPEAQHYTRPVRSKADVKLVLKRISAA